MSGVLDENATHRLGGEREKVRSIVPALLPGGEELQIGLVDQRRRLERVIGRLVGHAVLGDLVELDVEQSEQLRGSLRVALTEPLEEARDLTVDFAFHGTWPL